MMSVSTKPQAFSHHLPHTAKVIYQESKSGQNKQVLYQEAIKETDKRRKPSQNHKSQQDPLPFNSTPSTPPTPTLNLPSTPRNTQALNSTTCLLLLNSPFG